MVPYGNFGCDTHDHDVTNSYLGQIIGAYWVFIEYGSFESLVLHLHWRSYCHKCAKSYSGIGCSYRVRVYYHVMSLFQYPVIYIKLQRCGLESCECDDFRLDLMKSQKI